MDAVKYLKAKERMFADKNCQVTRRDIRIHEEDYSELAMSLIEQWAVEMDWDKAEEWLKEIESAYCELGFTGRPALIISINPLRDRFNKGERTQDLYDEIMELE